MMLSSKIKIHKLSFIPDKYGLAKTYLKNFIIQYFSMISKTHLALIESSIILIMHEVKVKRQRI